jgi:hypothetical protein
MEHEGKKCLRIRNHLGRDIYGNDARVLEVLPNLNAPDLSAVFRKFFCWRDRYYGIVDSGSKRKEKAGDITSYHFSLKELGEAFLGTYTPDYFADFLKKYLQEGEQEEALVCHVRRFRSLFRQVIVTNPCLFPLFDVIKFAEVCARKGVRRGSREKIIFTKSNLTFIDDASPYDFQRKEVPCAFLDLDIHGAIKSRLRRFRNETCNKAYKQGESNLVFCLNFPQLFDDRYFGRYSLLEEDLYLEQTKPTESNLGSRRDIPHELFLRLLSEARQEIEMKKRFRRTIDLMDEDCLLEHILNL